MNIGLRPDDLCRCGNGRLYGECHQAIMEAADREALNVARKIYTSEWGGNAQAYLEQGIYRTLSAELAAHGDFSRLVDIGCGLGHGLAALREQFPAADLIGLDENNECLAIAADRLSAKEIVSRNLTRMRTTFMPDGLYRSTPGDGEILGTPPLTLVQTNILVRDDALHSWLETGGPLDAATLWFVGIHKALSLTEIAAAFGVTGDADHRERVEDASLDFCRKHLRDEGVLQIVVRGGFTSEDHARLDIAAAYVTPMEDQAFEVISITPHRYSEPTGDKTISVRSRDAAMNGLPSYAVSIIARRRS